MSVSGASGSGGGFVDEGVGCEVPEARMRKSRADANKESFLFEVVGLFAGSWCGCH